jgi:hypothetical protein
MNAQPVFDEQKIRKASRHSAAITLLGVIIVGGAFLFSLYQLNNLNDRIEEKRAVLDSLTFLSEQKQKQIDVLRANTRELEQSYTELGNAVKASKNQKLERVFAQAVPLIAVTKAHAQAIPNNRVREGTRSSYDFSLWLEIPPQRTAEVRSVSYEFNHPTFANKRLESSNPADGFRVGYTGWGCLSSVIITLNIRDGSKATLDFDMCRDLGWPMKEVNPRLPPDKAIGKP